MPDDKSPEPGADDSSGSTPRISPRRTLGKIAALVAAVVVLVVAVTVTVRLVTGDSDDPPDDAAASEAVDGIKGVDFANLSVRMVRPVGTGTTSTLVDGVSSEPGFPDTEVGLHLADGPVYADADGDGDLDAAVRFEWVAAAGEPFSFVFVWLWDNGSAHQVEYPVTAGPNGSVDELGSTTQGFTARLDVTGTEGPSQHKSEDVGFTVADGYPVQTEPFGSVDRCVRFDDSAPGGRADGSTVRVAPDPDAPAIGDPGDFTSVATSTMEPYADGWVSVAATRSDGTVSCGWVPETDVSQ